MNEIIAVILGAIINSVAVILVGIISIYNTNKIKDIENEKEATKLYAELFDYVVHNNKIFNSTIEAIDEINKGNYTYKLNYYKILTSVNIEVRKKLRAMCEKKLNKGE